MTLKLQKSNAFLFAFFFYSNALIDEKQALLSKLTGNARYSYLFASDSTNSIEMKELDVIAKPKN